MVGSCGSFVARSPALSGCFFRFGGGNKEESTHIDLTHSGATIVYGGFQLKGVYGTGSTRHLVSNPGRRWLLTGTGARFRAGGLNYARIKKDGIAAKGKTIRDTVRRIY